MSILLAKLPGGQISHEELMHLSGGNDYFKEIGICFPLDGVLQKRTDFDSLTQTLNYIEENNLQSVLLYANSSYKSYEKSDLSPQIISEEYAYASCGDVLTLAPSDWKRSDSGVFAERILRLASVDAADLFKSKTFAWMMRRIAREYVSLAFMSRTGHFYLINSELFKLQSGVYYVEFNASKKQVISNSTKNNSIGKKITEKEEKVLDIA